MVATAVRLEPALDQNGARRPRREMLFRKLIDKPSDRCRPGSQRRPRSNVVSGSKELFVS
jgi:hypothetical protein